MTRINCNGLGQRFFDQVWPATTTIEPVPDDGVGNLIDSATFMRADCQLHWHVQDVLIEGQPAVLGGPKKALKTSVAVDLAVSVATGRSFLGRFVVRNPGRVGVISGESGMAVLKETFRRVCQAKQIFDPETVNIWWGFRLPQLSSGDDLDRLGEAISSNELKVMVIDPLYLSLLAGNTNLQASNLYHVGPLLSDATEVCLAAGATPVFLHHTRMGTANSFEPPDLGDLAFAGVQEFARQWILLGRREKFDPGSGLHRLWFNVGGSAGQSGCWALDIDEGLMLSNFTGRRWLVRVRTATEERGRVAGRKESERRDKERLEDETAREKIREVLRRHPDGETKNQIGKAAGIGKKLDQLIDEMLGDGEIEAVSVMKSAGRAGPRPQDGFRLVEASQEDLPEDAE